MTEGAGCLTAVADVLGTRSLGMGGISKPLFYFWGVGKAPRSRSEQPVTELINMGAGLTNFLRRN